MIQTEYEASSPTPEATQAELPETQATTQSETTQTQPERERIRILIYGSQRAVDRTISQLHLLRYIEQFRWNPIAPIPENGICITPAEAETYSFVVREVSIN